MDLTNLIAFADAYTRLGWAVQEQLQDLLDDPDADLNPEAVKLMKTLYPNLCDVDPVLEDELREKIELWEKLRSSKEADDE